VDFSAPELEAARVRLVARFGGELEQWWDRLPAAVARLADRWQLTIDEPVGRGGTSLVLRCRRSAGPTAVLKLIPERALADAEAHALRAWRSSGRVPELWAYDADVGALLLEAIRDEPPSPTRVALGDVADLIRSLHEAAATARGAVPLAERTEFIFDHWIARHGANPAVIPVVPMQRLERGRQLARGLVASAPQEVLLHGDLHPANVLDGGAARGLVAIDPRPCIGEPAFDAVDWVFWGTDDASAWPARASELATALATDADRVLAWCRAFAALIAAGEVARGGPARRVEALLDLAP
jgi:streptomycin 6-kinase